jgi:hypothetical protein
MHNINIIIKECMKSLQKNQFEYESDFKAHLVIELKKRISSVFVEYNILNFYLDNIEEYMNDGYIFIQKNNAPVIDIVVNYEEIFYPIELKCSFYNGTKNIGTDGKTALDGFIFDIKKIMNIKKINKGYCILLTNEKNFINEKIASLNDKSLINGFEWVDIKNYSYLFKEIDKNKLCEKPNGT